MKANAREKGAGEVREKNEGRGFAQLVLVSRGECNSTSFFSCTLTVSILFAHSCGSACYVHAKPEGRGQSTYLSRADASRCQGCSGLSFSQFTSSSHRCLYLRCHSSSSSFCLWSCSSFPIPSNLHLFHIPHSPSLLRGTRERSSVRRGVCSGRGVGAWLPSMMHSSVRSRFLTRDFDLP